MKFFWLILGALLTACSHVPSIEERRSHADRLAAEKGWHAVSLSSQKFDLVAYLPKARATSDALVIYIEGDGLAWINRSQQSTNPTPRDPVGLRMALAHPEGNVAYLARPCQYVDIKVSECDSQYWTSMRFAPEVIDASNAVINDLKRSFEAKRLVLVGYSGGGAMAALLAAKRDDVDLLVTVAGNLNHVAWTKFHRILPLTGSLNPADEIDALSRVPQAHFVGGKDSNITPELVRLYANRFTTKPQPIVHIEPEFDHHCCWAEKWPALWRTMRVQKN